jgi:cytochrome c553
VTEPVPTAAEPEAEPTVADADPTPEPAPPTGAEPEAEAVPTAEPTVEPKPEPSVEPKAEPKPEPKMAPKPEPKVEPKPEPKVEPKPEPPKPKAQPMAEKPPSILGSAAAGKSSFTTYCAVCHGAEGRGDGPAGAALTPKPRNFTDGAAMAKLSDAHLIKVISQGGASVGKSPLMAAWGGVLNDQQVKDVAAYVRAFSK